MSEDSRFNRNLKKEKDKPAPDFFGSKGEGMLSKENIETLETSSGLTPLGFGVDVRDRINRGYAGDIIPTTGNTEIKKSSGLSPICPFGEIHIGNLKSSSPDELFPETEMLKNSAGLTPLGHDSGIYRRRVIK